MGAIYRYYKKIYKCTDKLLLKLFGLNIEDSMVEMNKIKAEIESKIKKPIDDITMDDMIKNFLSHQYCKYRTMSKILNVLSGVVTLDTFYKEDIEELKR